jgi:hypothetical protein
MYASSLEFVSFVMTDGLSASLSWYKELICDLTTRFFCQTSLCLLILCIFKKLKGLDLFQSLTFELISPKFEITRNSRVEADKAAHDFSASIASKYMLSTGMITISGINNDLPGLDRLLNNK